MPAEHEQDRPDARAPTETAAAGHSLIDTVMLHVTKVTVTGGAIAVLLGKFVPDMPAWAQQACYVVACLLVMTAAYAFWRRQRARAPAAPALVQPGPTALLRGLLPFEDGDSLFGRRGDVQGILTIIRSYGFGFGVVWGPSGCGKTSLLRAGLIAELRKIGIDPVYLARPSLASDFFERAGGAGNQPEEGPRRLGADAPARLRTVVIVDQFEELFLGTQAKELVDGFNTKLAAWLGAGGGRRALVVGIREDFFARLQQLAGPAIEDPTSIRTCHELRNLKLGSATEILTASVASDATGFSIELIDNIIDDLDSDGEIRAADLQLVSTYLKQQGVVSLSRYEALGRAPGVLGSYIKKAMHRTGAEAVAAALLRQLCADDFMTKCPVPQTQADLMSALPLHGPAKSKAEVARILDQLQSSRIVIATETGAYALVHDYFAPLIAAATHDKTSRHETASLLLRRYLTQFRHDPGLRIPLLNLLSIQRNLTPVLRDLPGARKLLRRSWRAAGLRVIVPVVGLFVLPAVLLAAWLESSFYLATAPDRKGEDSRIVVRPGIPAFGMLPHFKEIVVATDYRMEDLDQESADAVERLPRGELGDKWTARPNGYDRWMDLINANLSPVALAASYRLLGNRAAARDLLVKHIDQDGAEAQLGLLALADPAGLSEDFLKPVLALPGDDTEKRFRMQSILADYLGSGVKAVPRAALLPIGEQLNTYRKVALTKKATWFDPRLRWYKLSLLNTVLSRPEDVKEADLATAMVILEDPDVPMIHRMQFLDLVHALGVSSPDAARRLTGKLAAMLGAAEFRPEKAESINDLERAVAGLLVDLARNDPASIAPAAFEHMAALVKAPPGAPMQYLLHVQTYSRLAGLMPGAGDPDADAALVRIAQGSPLDTMQRNYMSVWAGHVGLRTGKVSLDEFLRQAQAFLTQGSETLTEWKLAAAESMLAVLEDQPHSAQRKLALRRLVAVFHRDLMQTESELYSGIANIQPLLIRAYRMEQGLMTPTQARSMLDVIKLRSPMDAEQLAATFILLGLFDPEVIAAIKPELVAMSDKKGLYAHRRKLRSLTDAATAIAEYKRVSASQTGATLENTLWEQALSAKDPTERANGQIGLMLHAMTSAPAYRRILLRADNVARHVEPHHRMSANRLREMLKIGEASVAALNDTRQLPLFSQRVKRMYERHGWSPGTEHVRVAAYIAFDKAALP